MAHPLPLFEAFWTPNREVSVTPEVTRALAGSAAVAIGVSGGKDSAATALAAFDYLDERTPSSDSQRSGTSGVATVDAGLRASRKSAGSGTHRGTSAKWRVAFTRRTRCMVHPGYIAAFAS